MEGKSPQWNICCFTARNIERNIASVSMHRSRDKIDNLVAHRVLEINRATEQNV